MPAVGTISGLPFQAILLDLIPTKFRPAILTRGCRQLAIASRHGDACGVSFIFATPAGRQSPLPPKPSAHRLDMKKR